MCAPRTPHAQGLIAGLAVLAAPCAWAEDSGAGVGTATGWWIAGLALALLASLAWAWHLHRQGQRQVRALEQERQRLQVLMDTLPDLVWLKDLDGRYLFGNHAIHRWLGLGPGQLVGQRDADLVDANLAQAFTRSDAAALASHTPHRQELWQQFPATGRRGLFETLKTALRDRDGRVIGVLGVSRDITAQREAAEQLQRMNRLYRALTRVQEAVNRQPGQDRLLTEVCQILVEDDDLRLAWVAMPDAAAQRLVSVASAGRARAYLSDLQLPLQPPATSDPVSLAYLQGRVETSRDRREPGSAPSPWCEHARAHQLHAQAAFPMVRDGVPYAVLSLHAHQADYFTPGELSLIERLVAQVNLAFEAESAAADRRKALQALEQSESRFASLFRFSPVGMSLRRLTDGRLIDANRAWLELAGLRREQALGRAELQLMPWADPAQAEQARQTLLRQGLVDGLDVEIRRPDGAALQVSYAATRLMLGDEEHLLSAYLDTSLYHQAARALQAQAEVLESEVARRTAELTQIFQALPDLYFRIGADGTILDHRAGRATDLLHAPQDFLGRRLSDLLPPEVHARYVEAAARTRADAPPEGFEYTLNLAEGLQHFEARLMPLPQQQMVVVVRNVTERRRLEADRSEALREGERLARLRTQFLANMSHEIRTPLHGVLGMAQLGLNRSQDPQLRQTFQHILDSGQWLLNVVDDVLDISRLEAQRLTVESVPLVPTEVIGAVVELMQAEARARQLQLAWQADSALAAHCLGDPLRLRQVVLNLLSNALKFTDTGRVDLILARQEAHWTIEVRDTGPGLAPDALATLFQPFQQGDASSTRRHGGTGLGLAISQRLVRLMGGEISVHSLPGQGSRFTVTLPWREARPAPGRAVGPRLQGLRLLVAEDNPINQEVIVSMLRAEGASVTLAEDGQQALAQVAQQGAQAFDLVLMDLQMPVMDGFEAARRLQAASPDLPIVAQTAHAFTEERERSREAGMRDHITKPIDLDRLVRSVQQHARPHPDADPE